MEIQTGDGRGFYILSLRAAVKLLELGNFEIFVREESRGGRESILGPPRARRNERKRVRPFVERDTPVRAGGKLILPAKQAPPR